MIKVSDFIARYLAENEEARHILPFKYVCICCFTYFCVVAELSKGHREKCKHIEILTLSK